jgi:hypothetical protein
MSRVGFKALSTLVCLTASIQCCAAKAAQTCFTAFSGTVHYQFDGDVTSPGNHPLNGVEFGALSHCASLTKWPLTGTAINTKAALVFAWRAFNVDAADCGATDYIANLSPKTMGGSLQNHNDRTNKSNSSSMVHAACVAPPAAAAAPAIPHNGKDANGN